MLSTKLTEPDKYSFAPSFFGSKIILNPSKNFGPGENLLDMSEKAKSKKNYFWLIKKPYQTK